MSAQDVRTKARLVLPMIPAILAVLPICPSVPAQDTLGKSDSLSKSCSGLHAGIRAQIMPPYTETPSVMLTFVLLNDSSTPIDVHAESWKIVVDGNELRDSGMIFGNGPAPMGGYRILNSGESYEFGKSLPIAEYFLPNGSHKVSWRGSVFQSPNISVLITPASH